MLILSMTVSSATALHVWFIDLPTIVGRPLSMATSPVSFLIRWELIN